jgi:SAM-dependent methyltransferase
MGMDKGGAKLLLQEALQRPLTGRVLTLGKQDINMTFETLQQAAEELGVQLQDPGPVTLSDQTEFASRGCISDQTFFKALGFSEVSAMDYSDFESARHIHDLNSSEPPQNLLGSFDVIIDGGTIEHVFHLPNVLNSIHKMLRTHGRTIHMSPSSNHIDHGFYMFSPTLFWDFYHTNRYEINLFQVFRYTQRPAIDPWEVSNYTPGCLDGVSFGGLDDGMYGIFCVVTKKEDSTGDKIPQQGVYVRAWNSENEAQPATIEPASAVPQSDVRFKALRGIVKRIPVVAPISRFMLHRYYSYRYGEKKKSPPPPIKKGLGLKVVARY